MSNNTINNNNVNNNNMNSSNMNNYNMNDNMIMTNVSNYNMNNFNFDDEIDDTMANINNYLMKNKQYLEQDFSNNYNNPQKPRQSVTPSDLPENRRKSVNNMISCISLSNFKRNTQVMNQAQNQNMRKTLNFSNNNLKLLNSNNNRNSQSTDKGRKRYQSVFNNSNNNSINHNFPNINSRNSVKNITLKKSMSMDSEDSKNSAERKSHRINNNASDSLQKNIIKEEEELNSKISETESINNNNSIEEQKIKSNNNKINNKNESGEKKIIDKIISNANSKPNFNSININENTKTNLNINNLTPIKSKQNNENEKSIHKPISKISVNNANSMKSLSMPKEQNISNTKKLSDKKINNNIVINCDTKNNQNQTKNKEPIAYIISEKKINNNNTNNNNNKIQQQEIKLKNDDNSKQSHFDEGSQINDFTKNKYIKPSNSEFHMNFNSRNNTNLNNISTLRKDNTFMDSQKSNDTHNNHLPSFNLISIINYKNSANQSQNKNNNNNNITKSKDDKGKFSKTTNSLSPKNEIKNSYLQPPNIDQSNNTISVATEYKSFKGKKLDLGAKSFMAKITESIVPYELQNSTKPKNNNNNNNNKKGILKMKEKIYNSNNNLFFNQEEKKPKHYRNISMDDRNVEARNLQKMVHDLQSYISNYTSGFEDSNNLNIYKNGQNFIFKEMNNSYYGNNNNNHNHISNNSNKNKNNIFQLKLK